MTQEMEQFETHMDKMERLAQQQRHELALAQEKTKLAKVEAKKDTKETFLLSFAILATVAVIIAIIGAIYLGTSGPSAKDQMQEKQITRCYDEGGEWEPDRGDDNDPDDFVAAHCDLSKDGVE